MMRAFLLLVAVVAMFSGVHSGSESMSCSMVNGKMICEKQSSSGNVAMSSSMAQTGGGRDYQSAFAGTGNTATGEMSSSQSQLGEPPATFYYDTYPTGGDGGNAGTQGAAGGFGFASAGSGAGLFPGFFFGPGFAYPPPSAPPSGSAAPPSAPGAPQSGTAAPAGSPPQAQPAPQYPQYPQQYYPPSPGGFNPFAFVSGMMGGGFPFGGGAFAGAGAFAGRR